MNSDDPVGLLFGGMEKLGPGGNAHTLHVLRLLPKRQFRLVVDAGCGTGRQTLALAKELGTLVHAVDSYEPFLNDLVRRAREAKVERLVQAHCMDMKDIPRVFQDIDLLWSEGAAYNIGFSNALATWAPALTPDGFAVISELSWLKEQVPDAVREFFRSGYPDMQSVQHNMAVAESAGYKPLTTYTLPPQAWVDGFYDILAPRAKALLDHPAPLSPRFCRRNRQGDRGFSVFKEQLRVCVLYAPTRLSGVCRRAVGLGSADVGRFRTVSSTRLNRVASTSINSRGPMRA